MIQLAVPVRLVKRGKILKLPEDDCGVGGAFVEHWSKTTYDDAAKEHKR